MRVMTPTQSVLATLTKSIVSKTTTSPSRLPAWRSCPILVPLSTLGCVGIMLVKLSSKSKQVHFWSLTSENNGAEKPYSALFHHQKSLLTSPPTI
jgi:hypothetical protein